MSSGRKPAKIKAPNISAPPTISQTRFDAPSGDSYLTRQEKGTQITESILSANTRNTVGQAQQALSSLSEELNAPDARRIEDIRQRATDFYDLQADGINQQSDETLGRAASALSKRFGGALNASFGSDLLSRVEADRASQLNSARQQAALYGEDLYSQDENSRMQRYQLFQNYLTDLNGQARSFTSQDAATLQGERERAQTLAMARAQMVQQANMANVQNQMQFAAQKQQAIMCYDGAGLGIASAFTPASALGSLSKIASAGKAGTSFMSLFTGK